MNTVILIFFIYLCNMFLTFATATVYVQSNILMKIFFLHHISSMHGLLIPDGDAMSAMQPY